MKTENEALEMAQVLDGENCRLPVSRYEIAAMLRSQAAEIDRLKTQVESALSCSENANKLSTEFLRERDQLRTKNDRLLASLNATVQVHNDVLPIIGAYMGSLGIAKTWKELCDVTDILIEALKENT